MQGHSPRTSVHCASAGASIDSGQAELAPWLTSVPQSVSASRQSTIWMNSGAVGSTTAALLVVVVALAAMLTYAVTTPRQVTRTSTSSVTSTTTITVTEVLSSNQTWALTIIRSGITSPGYAGALVVCTALGFPCPNTNQSLPATLISYHGVYYYVSSVSTTHAVYTAWYTNSTVFCITPPIRYPSCPA